MRLGLYYIFLVTVIAKCDMVYFKNDTITDLLCDAQMSEHQSCPLLEDGVVITMIGTTRESVGCKETQGDIPVDKMAVKHLISQANDASNSSQLIYLLTDDGELMDGNSVMERNISLKQWNCIMYQHGVVLLKPKTTNIDQLPMTSLSIQTVLVAEYESDDSTDEFSQNSTIFSVTPDINTLVKVVNYFIMTTGWTRVGLLYDDEGTGLSNMFTDELSFTLQIYPLKYDGSNANEVYNQFKNRNVRVILFSGLVQNYLQVLDDMYDYYYTGIG